MKDSMWMSCKMFGRDPAIKKNEYSKKLMEVSCVSTLFILEYLLSSLFVPFGRAIDKPRECQISMT